MKWDGQSITPWNPFMDLIKTLGSRSKWSETQRGIWSSQSSRVGLISSSGTAFSVVFIAAWQNYLNQTAIPSRCSKLIHSQTEPTARLISLSWDLGCPKSKLIKGIFIWSTTWWGKIYSFVEHSTSHILSMMLRNDIKERTHFPPEPRARTL